MSLCKKYQCEKCDFYQKCGGCELTKGKPLGNECIAYKIVEKFSVQFLNDVEKKIIDRINSLGIPKLFVYKLNIITGSYVNLEYPFINGQKIKFLDDNKTYFANQIEIPDSTRCYGIVSDGQFILVANYGVNGADPILVAYLNMSKDI